VHVDVHLEGVISDMKLSPRILDSTAASSDENVRMRPVH